jgi:hypothetical protein
MIWFRFPGISKRGDDVIQMRCAGSCPRLLKSLHNNTQRANNRYPPLSSPVDFELEGYSKPGKACKLVPCPTRLLYHDERASIGSEAPSMAHRSVLECACIPGFLHHFGCFCRSLFSVVYGPGMWHSSPTASLLR